MDTRWSNTHGELDEEALAEWRAQWAPRCPMGNPQSPRSCLGYRERDPGRLQLRVALGGADHGVCEIPFLETETTVYVGILVCYDGEADEPERGREYMNCPVHIYLDQPLGDRTVYDVHAEKEVPLFVPHW